MSKGERLPRRSAEVVYVWRSMCVRREALTFECRAAVANFSSSGSSRTLDGVGRQRVCGLGSRLLIGEQRSFAEGNRAKIFHRTRCEIGNRDCNSRL